MSTAPFSIFSALTPLDGGDKGAVGVLGVVRIGATPQWIRAKEWILLRSQSLKPEVTVPNPEQALTKEVDTR